MSSPRYRLRSTRIFLLAALGSVSLVSGYGLSSQAQSVDPNPSFRNARDADQVPTARYARGENVDLVLIIEEWRDRFPQTPIYACACLEETCNSSNTWPFRAFKRYQPFVALGPSNAATNERQGFNCFNIETGENPT